MLSSEPYMQEGMFCFSWLSISFFISIILAVGVIVERLYFALWDSLWMPDALD